MKRKLFLLLCALLTMIGVQNVKAAYTDFMTPANGWTLISNEEQLKGLTLSNYYFSFVAAEDGKDLIVTTRSYGNSTNYLWYLPAKDPRFDNDKLFMLGNYETDYYSVQVASLPNKYFKSVSGEPWDFTIVSGNTAAEHGITMEFSDNKVTLKNFENNYFGAWNNEVKSGDRLAGNKASSGASKFFLYAIPRSYQQDIIASASESSPQDVSFLLPDAKIELTQGFSPWTGINPMGGKDDVAFCPEYWNASGFTGTDVYQEITNIPNGIYRITVNGFYRFKEDYEATNVDPQLYANGSKLYLPSISTGSKPTSHSAAAQALNEEQYLSRAVEVCVTNGKLKIGIKKTGAKQAKEWMVFDNFTLTYYGEVPEDPSSLIVNPGFEHGEALPNLTDVQMAPVGWDFVYDGSDSNSQWATGNAESAISKGIADKFDPSEGEQYYYIRTNWNSGKNYGIKQTISADGEKLPVGMYRLTCKAATYASETSTFTLSLQEGSNTPVSSATTTTSSSWQTWSVELYKESAATDLTIKANMNAGSAGGGQHYQLLLDDFQLSVIPSATTEDYAALNSAIEDAEAHNLGFEINEYAPYANVEALVALAAAKAINQSAVNAQSTVQAVKTALVEAVWTKNNAEVNAVYNGDFSLSTNDGAPAGWILTECTNTTLGGQYRPRAFVLTSGMTNYDKLESFGQGNEKRSAFYFRFDDRTAQNAIFTYGETDGYTMPLKANTIYKLTAQIGGWGQTRDIQMAIVNNSNGEVIAQKHTLENVDASGSVTDYEMYFVVPASGSYKLRLTNATSGQNNAAVISNIVLKSTDALVFADNAAVPTYAPGTYPSVKITRTLTANKWATAVYPFAVSGVDNIAVLDSYDSGTGVIGFTTAAASTANEPFLMRSTAGTSEISLSNVAVSATAANPTSVSNQMTMKGVYNIGTVPQSNGNQTRYAVVENELRKVSGATVNIKPFRAYFEIATGSGEAREFITLDFDGATAINAIEAANAETEEGLKDGKYLIDNKIVIVKNGVKYGANGQKLN